MRVLRRGKKTKFTRKMRTTKTQVFCSPNGQHSTFGFPISILQYINSFTCTFLISYVIFESISMINPPLFKLRSPRLHACLHKYTTISTCFIILSSLRQN
ncbi:hypothetical protein L1987_10889 [Smallanthus sonchifolius]|uniref:Uncharacterized protein n=1 Tax=Smallanthus sonchifolius TaxID=185202 RepID=A0ACB9JAD8_9ASTR|nr:hypothetical protein L1987_10889 [Smallanthus sonchifolius]